MGLVGEEDDHAGHSTDYDEEGAEQEESFGYAFEVASLIFGVGGVAHDFGVVAGIYTDSEHPKNILNIPANMYQSVFRITEPRNTRFSIDKCSALGSFLSLRYPENLVKSLEGASYSTFPDKIFLYSWKLSFRSDPFSTNYISAINLLFQVFRLIYLLLHSLPSSSYN